MRNSLNNHLDYVNNWLECSSYRDLRQGVDPELVLKDRCKFIRKVIDKRKKLEDELNKEQ